MADLAEVLTSSGHGGRFSFGLSTRRQKADASGHDRLRPRRGIFDLAAPYACHQLSADGRGILVRDGNGGDDQRARGHGHGAGEHVRGALRPDRPRDRSACSCAACSTTGSERGVNWRKYRLGVVIGEEIFGEHFRSYVACKLGLDVDEPDGGYIMSSFGVGELGLHLCFETPRRSRCGGRQHGTPRWRAICSVSSPCCRWCSRITPAAPTWRLWMPIHRATVA